MNNKTISIEEFVRDTLNQIAGAIKDHAVYKAAIPVQFELGVITTSDKSSKTSGGLGLAVASVLKAGTSGQNQKEDSKTEYNRITFTIELDVEQTQAKVRKPFIGAALN